MSDENSVIQAMGVSRESSIIAVITGVFHREKYSSNNIYNLTGKSTIVWLLNYKNVLINVNLI